VARILLTTFGSYGDLYPYLAIGIELRARGHDVTIATCAFYRPKVEAEVLNFHAIRPDPTFAFDDREIAAIMEARRGSERVLKWLTSAVRESYEDTLPAARRADLLVNHPINFASVLVAQKLGMPWVSTVLAPISLFSAEDPPVFAPAPWFHKLSVLSAGFMRLMYRPSKRLALGWVRPVVELRRELGLGPGGHPLFEGQHSPSLVLALFSRCLAEPQTDWPPQTAVTGFPFYDRGEIPPSLERFLAEGPAPVVFTLGSSAVLAAGDFYLRSLGAVERLGCRAVFLTGEQPQGLPEVLPPGVIAVPYAPHGAVFPRAAAIVHQGGIGTTAQAMRSGRPMLVVPFGHDQFDNGARACRQGAGEMLYRSRYDGRRVAEVLKRLMEQSSYAKAAAAVGEKVRAENGAAHAADAIESAAK
jgi:UDP:flavonoid glycosyltransferase YjiC (YdhE family)